MLAELEQKLISAVEERDQLAEADVQKPGVTCVGAISREDYETGLDLANKKVMKFNKALKYLREAYTADLELTEFLFDKQ